MELSLKRIAKKYADNQELAWIDLEKIVWPHGPVCPHCGVINRAYYLKPRNGGASRQRVNKKTGRVYSPSFRRVYKCADCRKQFSVLKGTIFESSHVKVSDWLMAFHLMCSNKNGISAHELHRELEVSYETAWFMAHRIRHAFNPNTPKRKLTGVIEMDETYVGGKQRGKSGRPGKDSNKTPVVATIERGGEVRARVALDVGSETLRSALTEWADPSAHLVTDQYPAYKKVASHMASHRTVDHSKGEYVRGTVHTNTIESFFGQFKRSLDGTYHRVSRKHLHRYTSEFEFRHNGRKESDSIRTNRGLTQTRGKRITYRQIVEQGLC